MGKRLIREHIVATHALVQLPWPDMARMFLTDDRKLRFWKQITMVHVNNMTPEEHAEVIALCAAPLSRSAHNDRIGSVMCQVVVRYSDRIHKYMKEESKDEAEIRRARAAKAERLRIRKLP